MSSSEPIDIEITLTSAYWKDAPKTKVYIDNEIIFDGAIAEKKVVKYSGTLDEGIHKITIELYDKDKYQTVLENGNIIKDQLLNITDISFDEIDIGFLIWQKSKYYPTIKENLEEYPITQCTNLGWNGKWELEFTTPIYIWLLENI
jgi:hypothetical protein